eukprot:jgi/Botrbrau1/341/Bobra.0022s0295.1
MRDKVLVRDLAASGTIGNIYDIALHLCMDESARNDLGGRLGASWCLRAPLAAPISGAVRDGWGNGWLGLEAGGGSQPSAEASDVWPDLGEPLLESRMGPRLEAGRAAGSRRNQVLMAAVFGAINSVVAIPAMISFTAIIYQDEVYEAYLPQLAKLAFLSSAVHQTVFLLSSTLPFAVGQVQDVGLIFLSAMASSIAARCAAQDLPVKVALGTSLGTQAIATLFVGLFIIVVGKLRLASLVQYVPLPVVGGYLGYVGFFCFLAGVSLATGVQVRQVQHLWELWAVGPLQKLGMAVAGTAAMAASMHVTHHPLSLPLMLLLIPAAFYAVLLGAGISLQQARDAGWVAHLQGGHQSWRFWEIYELYNVQNWTFDGWYFPAMLRQLPTLFPLFFVVAFGSSMDVAAISQEMNGAELDYDTELLTVGYSNLATAMVGAPMTGSYIFSQTVFSLRSGVTSRANGLVVAISEFFLFAAPFSALPYLPSFYFGSLMMLIGWEIISDWLLASYRKGVWRWASGRALSWQRCHLPSSYARVHVTAFTLVPSRSSTMRPFQQRAVLELFSQRMAAVALSGYIFFGSAITISKRVLEVAQALLEAQGAEGGDGALRSSKAGPGTSWFTEVGRGRVAAALAAAPRLVILDFRNVDGLDATAARTFGSLATSLHSRGAGMLVTHVRKRTMQRLLAAHGVVPYVAPPSGAQAGLQEGSGAALLFPTMDSALETCEETFLAIACQYRLCAPATTSMSLAEILRSHLETPKVLLFGTRVDYGRTAATLMNYMQRFEYSEKDVLFRPGDPADDLYIVEEGTIRVQMDFLGTEMAAVELPEELTAPPAYRYFNMGPASIVGDMDFFLQRPRSFMAVCASRCRLLRMGREAFNRLALQAPQALIVLQAILLCSASLNETHALEVLERSSLPR